MTRILFTGYAPVHFVCVRPLFDQLIQDLDESGTSAQGQPDVRDPAPGTRVAIGQPQQDLMH